MADFNPNYLKNLEPLPEIVVEANGTQTTPKRQSVKMRSTEERVGRAMLTSCLLGAIMLLFVNIFVLDKTGMALFWSMWTYAGLWLFLAACVISYFQIRKTQRREPRE